MYHTELLSVPPSIKNTENNKGRSYLKSSGTCFNQQFETWSTQSQSNAQKQWGLPPLIIIELGSEALRDYALSSWTEVPVNKHGVMRMSIYLAQKGREGFWNRPLMHQPKFFFLN